MQAQGWSDQELLLLLEGVELYGDSWADIAEHVGTKSQVPGGSGLGTSAAVPVPLQPGCRVAHAAASHQQEAIWVCLRARRAVRKWVSVLASGITCAFLS